MASHVKIAWVFFNFLVALWNAYLARKNMHSVLGWVNCALTCLYCIHLIPSE